MVVLTCFGGKFKQVRAITAIEENFGGSIFRGSSIIFMLESSFGIALQLLHVYVT